MAYYNETEHLLRIIRDVYDELSGCEESQELEGFLNLIFKAAKRHSDWPKDEPPREEPSIPGLDPITPLPTSDDDIPL